MSELCLIISLLSGTFAGAFLFAAMVGFQVSLNEDENPKPEIWRIFDTLCLGSFVSAIVGALKNCKKLPESRNALVSGLVSLAVSILFLYLHGKAH